MGCHSLKTGNVFVTESFPKYTISCFFTACSREKTNEVSTNGSAIYAILSVFAFWMHSFATKLRIRYPALKSHDILICCLIKLRISNEYIASLTCCKYESVLTKRFRIKQRMNEKEENLESIINHIS